MKLITNPNGLVKDNPYLYSKVKEVIEKNMELFSYNNFYDVDFRANIFLDAIELEYRPKHRRAVYKRLKIIELTEKDLDALVCAKTKQEFLAVFGKEFSEALDTE